MKQYKYRFTIWTAAYNAENTIVRCFKSIEGQKRDDFEWIVVNDGSTDKTLSVIKDLISKVCFPVKLIDKPNGGKHTALAAAAEIAEGRYVIIIDADDELTRNALNIFDKHWKDLERSEHYSDFWQVKGRCADENMNMMGKPLPASVFDSDYNTMHFIIKNKAEMECCSKIEVMQNEAKVPDSFLFQDKCNNFGEGIRWSRAARVYKTRFIDDIVRVYHHGTEGSLTQSNKKKRNIKHTYNLFVYEIYSLKERRDLIFKNDKKTYIKTIAALTYHSNILNQSISKLYLGGYLNKLEVMLCTLMSIPMKIVSIYRETK